MLDIVGEAAQKLTPYVPTICCASGEPIVHIDGKDIVQFCTSNYLGLATDFRVKTAAKNAIDKYGVGTNGSRLISGTLDVHRQLETRIAKLKGTDSATLFSTGTLANLGFLQAAIAHPLRVLWPDASPKGEFNVFYDGLIHQSLLDGIHLAAPASAKHFKHNDIAGLARLLDRSTAAYKMVVVDGVYSADGDVAPLDQLVDLCIAQDALLLVDDSHGTGVLGTTGCGTCELFGVESAPCVVQMGTLSKSFGSNGGFIAGSQAMTDYLRVAATSYVFTAALPASMAAAALAAIDIAEQEPWRRQKALSNASYVRDSVVSMGFEVGESCTQVVPIILGCENLTREISGKLLKAGLYAPSVEFPAAARGNARIRISNTALHEIEHLDRLLNVLDSSKCMTM
jgi:8-amino-7-oxononanoate synthase